VGIIQGVTDGALIPETAVVPLPSHRVPPASAFLNEMSYERQRTEESNIFKYEDDGPVLA
ncbi:hypothetical protein PENARI_c056G06606, partial [Penicillium arizonense]